MSRAGKPHGRYWLLHPDSWQAGTMPCRSWLGEASKAVNAIGFHGTSSEMTWRDSLMGVISRSISSPAVLAPLDPRRNPNLLNYRGVFTSG